jgi:hypothetical protein
MTIEGQKSVSTARERETVSPEQPGVSCRLPVERPKNESHTLS